MSRLEVPPFLLGGGLRICWRILTGPDKTGCGLVALQTLYLSRSRMGHPVIRMPAHENVSFLPSRSICDAAEVLSEFLRALNAGTGYAARLTDDVFGLASLRKDRIGDPEEGILARRLNAVPFPKLVWLH